MEQPDSGHEFRIAPEHQRRLANAVMRRQLDLSVKIAVVFLLMLFGLPLVNRWFPDAANTPILGFTATWLFLGVLFYPITWLLSWIFIKRSNDIEHDIATTMQRGEHNSSQGSGEQQ